MKNTKPKLTVYILQPSKREGVDYELIEESSGALVEVYDSSILGFAWTKAEALSEAKMLLHGFAKHGQPCELRIRKRDGTFGLGRTYPRGADPRRSKG